MTVRSRPWPAARLLAALLVLLSLLPLRPGPAAARENAGETSLLSKDGPGSAISADGQYAAFWEHNETTLLWDLRLVYLPTGLVWTVPLPDERHQYYYPDGTLFLSADGRYLAFDFEYYTDFYVVYRYDRVSGALERVAPEFSGHAAFAFVTGISGDGRYVSLESPAIYSDPSYGYVYDHVTNTILSLPTPGDSPLTGSVSWHLETLSARADEMLVVGGTYNNHGEGELRDLYIYNRQQDSLTRVAVTPDGGPIEGSTGDGFEMSADGRSIAFSSVAEDLVPGDTNGKADVFVYDRHTAQLRRISLAPDGAQANDHTYLSSISADGRAIILNSMASNMVDVDTNGGSDLFLYDQQTDLMTRVSVASDGSEAGAGDFLADESAVSGTGREVLMHTGADGLVPGSDGYLFLRRVPPERLGQLCFVETGLCIDGHFGEYWRDNGGLPVFGFPITAAAPETNRDTGQIYLTQWFQRNRLELHPANPPRYRVLLGRLGDERLRQLGVEWQMLPADAGPQTGCLWFEETRHNVCNQAAGLGFKRYWEGHGLEFDGQPGTSYAESLALFGLPLTSAQLETNSSGDTVLTQWFERVRFEWHPDKPDEYKVLLGLLGNELH